VKLLVRVVRLVLITIVVILVGGIALGVWIETPGGLEKIRRGMETASFRILARAKTPDELNEAVGNLGIVFRTQDGGWLAIRYRDTHGGGIVSSSVARDSEGRWFVSSHHFCGKFQGYRMAKEDIWLNKRSWRQDDLERTFPSLLRLDQCENLEEARELLIGLEFEEVDPPTPDITDG
jgi:hypothetical protein